MKTMTMLSELRTTRASLTGPIGLVPTMGYLHAGHLSLVEAARRECNHVVVSIFVNPSQFGPDEDLEAYPRDTASDLKLLEEAGVDVIWMPTPEAMYPQDYQTWVTVEQVSRPLEGSMRPGHFKGVTTIVAKLFNAVQPHRAYFGQKDAQQAAVIQRMVYDLNFPIKIVVGPIVRADDGLALSSRNAYLNDAERQAALVLHKALKSAKALIDGGERDADQVRNNMIAVLDREPLAFKQYVSCADPYSLVEIDLIKNHALLSLAVHIGNTRLIDNFLMKDNQWLAGN
jgi:pantoate--beta-alanine ligase